MQEVETLDTRSASASSTAPAGTNWGQLLTSLGTAAAGAYVAGQQSKNSQATAVQTVAQARNDELSLRQSAAAQDNTRMLLIGGAAIVGLVVLAVVLKKS